MNWTHNTSIMEDEEAMACYDVFDLLHLKNSNRVRVKSAEQLLGENVKFVLIDIGIPVVCAFGILGNILNLVVLTRKQLKCSMDRMEKSAHLGLVALAVCDMFYCVLTLSFSLMPNTVLAMYDADVYTTYYRVYVIPFMNCFLITSTWLTVIMAIGRYVAICHPLHARGFINLQATRISITCIFIFSFLFVLPTFWYTSVVKRTACVFPDVRSGNITNGHDMCHCDMYQRKNNRRHTLELAHNVLTAVLVIVIPLAVLLFCNICLIRALQRSYRMQQQYRANRAQDSGHRITPTLITIIILFILFVIPSEVLKLVNSFSGHSYHSYQLARYVINFLMTVNFAINFVLYCVINVHFRKTVKQIIFCKWRQKKKGEYFRSRSSVMNTTMTCNVSDIETEV